MSARVLDINVMLVPYWPMESVKSGYDDGVGPSTESTEPPGFWARLLSWRGSDGAGALDRDPTLWMHRDVTA